MKKIKVALLAFLLSSPLVYAQQELQVPMDPGIISGTLDNGMKYYIKANQEPEERVSFYFAQNVGSVLEKDSQRGLAHFLEHMAFNGTQHFKDKQMLEYLQKNGVKFGSEINAFTSFDETVYNISKVPTTNERLLDSVLLVLHDWSGYLSLTDQEIDNERGVINEEWRSRNTAAARASFKIWEEGLLKGSAYEERLPIGTMEVVNNFRYEELRDYYKTWYRPDQQAIVIVGDIDARAMEEKVRNLFSGIPLHENLPERPSFEVPVATDFAFIEATDKELAEPVIQFYIKNKPDDLDGVEKINQELVKNLSVYIFSQRLRELAMSQESPVLNMSFSYSSFVRSLDLVSMNIQPRSENLLEAFQYAQTQLKKYITYGPTEGELERARRAFSNSYASSLKNIAKISSDAHGRNIYNHFLHGGPLPEASWNYQYMIQQLEKISHQDILDFLQSIYNKQGQVVAIMGSNDREYPKKEQFQEILARVESRQIVAYEEDISDLELITEPLSGSPVTERFEIDGVPARGYVLSNGAKIVLYPTDYDQDKILLSAFSPGGTSLLPVEDLASADMATYIASESGLGQLDKIALGKKLAGTNTSLNVGLGDLSESLSGSSTTTDIEVLFQKIYLSFTAPRFDKEPFNLILDRMHKSLATKARNVESAFRDSLSMARVNHNPRQLLFNEDMLAQIDLETAERIYRDRIQDASDFTFVFVGDFQEDALLELAQKYIGSIPSENRTENFVNHNLGPASGKTQVKVYEEMETPQTTVNISLSGDYSYSTRNSLMVQIAGQLLSKRYLERIREEEGGSYGVSAGARLNHYPQEQYGVNISFKCNPDKADDLIQIVYQELQTLEEHVKERELREAKESIIKGHRERQNNNSYWLGVISGHLSQGTDIVPLEEYIALVNSINSDDIKKIARVFNTQSDVVEGVLHPKL